MFFPTTVVLRVSFSPAPYSVDRVCWNRFVSTPPRGTRSTVIVVIVIVIVVLLTMEHWDANSNVKVLRP